jgi:hypothetical protein
MKDDILTDKELSNSAFTHIINVPLEKIDIADWLLKLPEAEYQRCCPPDHIACGATSIDDGKPMSLNSRSKRVRTSRVGCGTTDAKSARFLLQAYLAPLLPDELWRRHPGERPPPAMTP